MVKTIFRIFLLKYIDKTNSVKSDKIMNYFLWQESLLRLETSLRVIEIAVK